MNKNFGENFENIKTDKEPQFRHNLIQKEFREALAEGKCEIPMQTDGIMVHSAPPALEFKDNIDHREKTRENIWRIDFAFDVFKQIAAQKLDKTIEELKREDLKDSALPLFILNGETEQLPAMKEVAIAIGVPEEKIYLINSGDRGVSNSRTQQTAISKDPITSNLKHITLVTSSYHVPRLARTASKNLPEKMNFDVIGVPFKDFSYDVFRKVRGEVKRIVSYSEKGDISNNIRVKSSNEKI